MVKENDGKAKWSNRHRRRLLIGLVCATAIAAAIRTASRIRIRALKVTKASQKYPIMFDSHHPQERAILEGKYFLIDISISFGALAPDDTTQRNNNNKTTTTQHNYGSVSAIFCPLDWSLQKTNPSTVPMFRVLVAESKHCNPNRVTVDLHAIAKKARLYDKGMSEMAAAQKQKVPLLVKTLKMGGAVFHESRCGSTLVSNLLVASNPQANRVYSESSPPINALRACAGQGGCDDAKHISLLRDVIYLMSRSQSSQEQNVFFKIQSVGTHVLNVWTKAFPTVPWIFVYRDPVEVIMSHLKHGGDEAKRAACLRSRQNPPPIVLQMVKDHSSTKDVGLLSSVEYCAAHLATLCHAALQEYRRPSNTAAIGSSSSSSKGQFLNYASLPDSMWESVLPNHFDVENLSEQDIERMKAIAQVYSKGFQEKANMPWSQDSDRKQEDATQKMKVAAKTFLEPYFLQLEATHHENENDQEESTEVGVAIEKK